MIIGRTTFTRNKKDFYFLTNPTAKDSDYLSYFHNLFTNKYKKLDDISTNILTRFMEMGFFPLKKGDIFSVTNDKNTIVYEYLSDAKWKTIETISGQIDIPELALSLQE